MKQNNHKDNWDTKKMETEMKNYYKEMQSYTDVQHADKPLQTNHYICKTIRLPHLKFLCLITSNEY